LDDLVFHRDSNPYALQYSEWTVLWWKWLLSIPKKTNPALDTTGRYCHKSQTNQNAWFLAGTRGGPAERRCKIPYGKAILFPVITSEFSFSQDPNLNTEEQLIRAVEQDIDTVNRLMVVVDGITLEGLDVFRDNFRVRSQPFDFKIEGVNTRIVSDGYWIFLKPPNIGPHTIYFVGRNVDFFNEVRYKISVTSVEQI